MIRLTRMLLFLLLFALLAGPVIAQAQPTVAAVLNAASHDATASPGCWVSVWGTDLAAAVATADSVPLPKTLGDVTVTVGGLEAPLLFVSPGQVNALVPFEVEVPEGGLVPVTVTTPEGTSNVYPLMLTRTSPALFTLNATGQGIPFMFTPNFEPIEAVQEDDVVILYAAGLGLTDPPASSDTGGSASEPFNRAVEDVQVFIGEREAEVLFAGLAPGFPGVFQLNIRVPNPITDRLFLRSAGMQSNIVEVGTPYTENVTNISANIEGLYPTIAPNTPPCFAPPFVAPIDLPVVPYVGRFSVQFDILPDAKPFTVAAVGDSGSSIIFIDPVQGTYEGVVTMPTERSRMWDFSGTELPPLPDFATCHPEACDLFPDNMIPLSRVSPEAMCVLDALPLPQNEILQSTVGELRVSGSVQPGSTFVIDQNNNSMLSTFGGYLQIPFGPLATRTATFTLYVDGSISIQASYAVVSNQGILGPSDAVTIFDSFGPLDGSGQSGGVCLGCGEDLVHANAFSVPQGNDYRLVSLEVPVDVSIFSSPPPVQFRLRLMSDADGEPGEIIEEFMATATTPFPDGPEVLSLDSVLKPVLTGGTRYWLAGTAEPSAGVTWYAGSTEGMTAQSVSGRPWAINPNTELNGFRIIGQPIP